MLNLERSVALKIAEIQEQAAQDPKYLALWKEYSTICPKLLSLLEQLPPADACIVEDYLGVAEEMQRYLLELACK